MFRGVRAGTAMVLCILFVLFGPPEYASAEDAEVPEAEDAAVYETYSTGVKIIEYGATGTPASYCSNLKVDDDGAKDAFCIEPGVDFAGGPKRRIDALEVIPQDALTDAALGVYYLSTVEPAEGLSRLGWQQYWIWVELRKITVPGVTDIWVRNGPSEAVQDSVLRDIRAYVAENRSMFKGYGYIYTDGSSQRVARFWVEGRGSVSLTKAPSDSPALIREFPELYSLAGAEYTVYNSSSLAGSARMGTLITDGNGKTETLDLAAGTYYVLETKAPYGYIRNTSVMEKTLAPGERWEIEAEDEPLFGSAEILIEKRAVGDGSGESAPPLSGAEFKVRYYPTLSDNYAELDPARVWIFCTDADGKARLSDEYRTGGDELFRNDSGGPMLLIGTYTFEETAAPEGYLINRETAVRRVTPDRSASPETVMFEAPAFNEYLFPEIGTEAFWSGGTKNLAVSGETEIIDRVNCRRLLPGREYVLKASLVDPDDGRTVAQGEKTFVAEGDADYADAEVDVPITVGSETAAELAGESGGGRFVVFEELYLQDGGKELLMAEEKTLDSPEQSVSVPRMGTSASVSKTGEGDIPTVLTDVIEYSGLCPGVEICVETTLVNRADGEPVVGTDGEPVKAVTAFTPELPDGTLEVSVEIPTEQHRGLDLVFFEHAYEDGKEIMSHADRDNDKQTVSIPEAPQPPVVPKTGDDQSIKSYIVVFGTSAFFLMCAAVAKRALPAFGPFRKTR
ncbi:MAG: VaFE repeat-containing surface-anchored protein [Clostridia bacterium]|nr:VaFE repeat-containing surface-anchored protein [Clostridia bacterium]